MGNVHWTEQEVNTLKRFYATVPMTKLVSMFPGRTEQAIRAIASRMGLKRLVQVCGVHHRKSTFYGQSEKVEQIRVEYNQGDMTCEGLGEKYGISAVLAHDIISGKRYPNCGGPISVKRHLTDEDVEVIRRKRLQGVSLKEIAILWKISESMVSRICLGRRHEDKPGPIVGRPYEIRVKEE